MEAPTLTRRRRVVAVTDPLVHGLLAAAVATPLVSRFGRRPVLTAVLAGTLIDLDHPVAARSLRLHPLISMPTRPRTHSVLSALAAGAVGTVAGGPVHGWAAFGGLASHLLHDAGDRAAPTPLLWPWAPPRQLGRRWWLTGTVVLMLGSWGVSRTAAVRPGPSASSCDAGGAGGPARRRTA